MPNSRVIVLDPGHGGSNQGLNYEGFLEKDMTLATANAVKAELEKYEGVEVYITNPNKEDMSLEARAEYAKSKGANVVISLHFNMSEEHTMYGSEVWIPSKGLGYSQMHALGDIFCDEFAELGLTQRGVKTRLNDRGTDYYGIIRNSTAKGIPCILVEHAHADHVMDRAFIDSEEAMLSLAKADATAIAKYFGLKSKDQTIDYSTFVKNGYFAPEAAIGSDSTQPYDAVMVYRNMGDNQEHYFEISAKEDESDLVYYEYSLDGGETWSELFPFERGQSSMKIKIDEIKGSSQVMAKIYNGHFLSTETNVLTFEPTREQNPRLPAALEEESSFEALLEELKACEADEQAQISKKLDEIETQNEENMRLMEEKKQAMKVPTRVGYLSSGFLLFLSVILFVACFSTKKYAKNQKEKRRAISFFFAGLVCVMISVGGFAASYAGSQSYLSVASNISDAEMAQIKTNKSAQKRMEVENNLAKIREELVGLNEEEDIRLRDIMLTSDAGDETLLVTKPEVPMVTIYDIAEGYMQLPLLESVAKNPYRLDRFTGENLTKSYQDGNVNATLGIDISKFQGNVDFAQVKAAGVEFVILRLGIRGYTSGELKMDERFEEYVSGAQENGLKVGVYFFSQAVNEAEAVEEAKYVLKAIEGKGISMPVVFDTEPILYDSARTDNLTSNQLTAITRAFMEEIKSAGYTPMIYANSKRLCRVLHLDKLTEYPVWLADYRDVPDYPYSFKMWQFTEKGSVPGIEGNVDIDLYLE